MYLTNTNILKNRFFLLFALNQGISNLASSFGLIAIASLVIGVTHSGTNMAYSIVYSNIITMALLPMIGYISDKFSPKLMLILLDIFKSLIILFFIMDCDKNSIYFATLMLGLSDTLYNPSRKKILLDIVNNNQLTFANSFLSGISGVAYIVGSAIAGYIISTLGIKICFFIMGILLCISPIVLIFINTFYSYTKDTLSTQTRYSYENTIDILKDCVRTKHLRNVIILF